MGRRALIVLLVAAPGVALGALGVVVVASATAHQSTAAFHAADHFASRQVFALILAAMVAIAFVELGPRRLLRAAPVTFACALLAAGAVFAPGVGVHAAGANRWLHIGPFSGDPAPLLTAATAMLMAAWSAPARPTRDARAHVPLAIGLGGLAVLTFVAEPDFSAAAITALVVLVALAGAGVGGRRLVPAAAATVIVLALVASRFGYVNGRVRGFLAPEADRRGKGFEVLALERAHASATRGGVGLGHGLARHRLSSPGSDYVFAVVTEEMGRVAAGAVAGAWLAIGAGAWLAARATNEPRLRAATLAAGAAALAPAALHIAVCQGWLPIIGVSMPLVSYDPAATVAAGAELGLIASVALAPRDMSAA
ncbi:MAG TPA: FtsW/RodA/SpoVE family cell cycle protein [Polyangia bacterium]|nr:FtsW/RodA/SpoVE family cell cycle protein [Polyangia bacterium]